MRIEITQSALNATGFAGIDFPNLSESARKNVAAQVCSRLGDSANAMLLEINNPIAVNSIYYVRDVPVQNNRTVIPR